MITPTLAEIEAATTAYAPRTFSSASTTVGPTTIGPAVEILPAASFAPEPIRWLWEGWMARGKMHLLAGAPGTGKTTIAVSLAARISAGGLWPDGSAVDRGSVLIWSGEDDIADTLVPRLLAEGGDPSSVHFVTGMDEDGRKRTFDPAADMPRLAQAARLLPDLRLLILDPIVSAVAADSHKNSETRRGLQPVVDIANQLDCAVLGITHLAKNSSGREPLDRVNGSVAFGAVARVVLATVKPADPQAPRRLIRAKSNLGPDSGGFDYQLFVAPVPGHAIHAQRVGWGEVLEGSARELMAVEVPDAQPKLFGEAQAFLTEALRDGPAAVDELRDASRAHGHAWRTIERAKKALGVIASKTGKKWFWALPPAKPANTANASRVADLAVLAELAEMPQALTPPDALDLR